MVSSACCYLWSLIHIPLGLSERLLRSSFSPGALFLSSPLSRSLPAHQHLPHAIRTPLKSLPEKLCVVEPPSISQTPSARRRPRVPWPTFSSAVGFVSFLCRDDSSSGFLVAPERSYLPSAKSDASVGSPISQRCPYSVQMPSEYVVMSAILRLSLHPHSPRPWSPLVPIMMSVETILVPHRTL